MFVVYSPEGQTFAANAQQLPVIKVDPSTRINQVTDTELKELDVDSRLPNKNAPLNKKLSAYQQNKQSSGRRKVVKVAEIMSSPVITIELNSHIYQAYERMNRLEIDYLPVVNNDTLIGICTRSSLLKRLIINEDGRIEQGGMEMIESLIQKQVVTTNLETDIRQVAQVFSQYQVGAIVITSQDERLVGIVTHGDLIKRLAQEPPIELYI